MVKERIAQFATVKPRQLDRAVRKVDRGHHRFPKTALLAANAAPDGSISPDTVALEDIFVAKNANSALKLGHVRGAVMSAAVLKNCPLFEYTPTRVKKSVAGNGRADKVQIQHMVKIMLKLRELAQEDASDALAIAITHAFAV